MSEHAILLTVATVFNASSFPRPSSQSPAPVVWENSSQPSGQSSGSWFHTAVASVYCGISLLGICGNTLVLLAILRETRMRRTTTNMFLLNLAVADLIIMLLGVQEITHYLLDRGWLLGLVGCKFCRMLMTSALYVSVLTLVAVCIERYIAVVHPMKASLWCTRKRTLMVIACVWPLALLLGLPTLLFLGLVPGRPSPRGTQFICVLIFDPDMHQHHRAFIAFKLSELGVFYVVPLVLQIYFYRRMYLTLKSGRPQAHTGTIRNTSISAESSTSEYRDRVYSLSSPSPCSHSPAPGNHTPQLEERSASVESGSALISKAANQQTDREQLRLGKTLRARKQVVRMLIACVTTYFVCYAPTLVPPLYSLITGRWFQGGEVFRGVVMTVIYANSAANPLLYTAFSKKFRGAFVRAIFCRSEEEAVPCVRVAVARERSSHANMRSIHMRAAQQQRQSRASSLACSPTAPHFSDRPLRIEVANTRLQHHFSSTPNHPLLNTIQESL